MTKRMINRTAPGWLIPLYALFMSTSGQAASILQVEVANYVFYVPDGSAQAQWFTQPQVTQLSLFGTFSYYIGIGDIVAINGKPARGTYIQRAVNINSSPNPMAGELVADIARGNLSDVLFDLQTADVRLVGSIIGVGFLGGSQRPHPEPRPRPPNSARP